MARPIDIDKKPLIGRIICNYLKENNKNQKMLAEELNIRNTYLNSIILGKNKPSLKLLNELSKKTELPVEDLVNALFEKRDGK